MKRRIPQLIATGVTLAALALGAASCGSGDGADSSVDTGIEQPSSDPSAGTADTDPDGTDAGDTDSGATDSGATDSTDEAPADGSDG